ncbi:MAG TPA: MFS transporter [Bryobacteraceae bacterium]|nr:MFS transporter [Bryobacteraceae bacterium]
MGDSGADRTAVSDRIQASPRYKWALVLTLFFVSTLNYADRTAITALYTLLKTDLGFTDVGLGALGSVFLWTYASSSPFAGFLGDRVRRGRLVMWSLAGWSLVTLLTGLAATQWQLLGMRGALGLVESMYLPAAMALVAEYHGPETRGTALALMALGNYVGMAGGGAVAGYFGEQYGWRMPLITLGAAGLLLAAICWFVLPAGRAKQPAKGEAPALSFPASAAALIRIPSFLVLAGAGVLTAIGTWIFINWLPLYFRENLGMTLASAGFFGSSVVSLSGAAGQVVGGVTSDRVARGGPHRRMLLHAALILCAAPTLLVFVLTRNATLIMAALVIYSLLRTSGDVNMLPLICDLAGVDKRSTAFGITNMVNTLAGGLGVFVAGYLKSGFGLEGVFAGVAGILALDSVLLFTGYFFLLCKDLRRSGVVI